MAFKRQELRWPKLLRSSLEPTAPSFKKSWDRGRISFATADLFTQSPSRAARLVKGDIIGEVRLKSGDIVTVERGASGALIAKRGLTEVAYINQPTADVVRAVDASCGVARGTVEQVHDLAAVAEISLC